MYSIIRISLIGVLRSFFYKQTYSTRPAFAKEVGVCLNIEHRLFPLRPSFFSLPCIGNFTYISLTLN